MSNRLLFTLVLFVLIPFFGCAHKQKSNKDLRMFYHYRSGTSPTFEGYHALRKRMVKYYEETQKNHPLPLVERLMQNSRLLEYDPEHFSLHTMIAFNVLANKNLRFHIAPEMQRLEGQIKFIKNKELKKLILHCIGDFYNFSDRPEESRKYYFRALVIAQQLKDSLHQLRLYYDLSSSYLYSEDNTEKAEKFLSSAMELRHFGTPQDQVSIMILKAFIEDTKGDTKKAISIYLKLVPQVVEEDKAVFYNNLGWLYLKVNQLKKAETNFLISKKYFENVYHFEVESVYGNLSECYSKMKDYKKSHHYMILKDSVIEHQKKTEHLLKLEELKKRELIRIGNLQKVNSMRKLRSEQTKNTSLVLTIILIAALFGATAVMLVRIRIKNRRLVELSLNLMKNATKTRTIGVCDEAKPNKKIQNDLIEKLEKLLNEKEIFTIQDITLHKLSKRLGTNIKDLSQTINNYYGVPFRTLINAKRVELAKSMLIESKYAHYSMAGIAESVGYANKSSFYKHFKEITGVTPSNFQLYAKELIAESTSFAET